MAKLSRGTKRTCQNDDCESKFYDLERDPIVCPVCSTVYKLARAAEMAAVPAAAAAAPIKAAAEPDVSTDGDVISDDDDALISLEDADAELGEDDDDDDTFLADDEDEPGVVDIIGGEAIGDGDEEEV